jgi:hypothetical protein
LEKENTLEAFRLFEKQFRRILEGGIGRVIGAFRQMAISTSRVSSPVWCRMSSFGAWGGAWTAL